MPERQDIPPARPATAEPPKNDRLRALRTFAWVGDRRIGRRGGAGLRELGLLAEAWSPPILKAPTLHPVINTRARQMSPMRRSEDPLNPGKRKY